MVRGVASRVSEQDRERAIGDGVDCLIRTESDKPQKRPPFRKFVTCLQKEGLAIVEADKEGGFVVMPQGMFDAKAHEAIQKNFKPSVVLPKNQKAVVLRLLKNGNLEHLRKAVTKSKKCSLEAFLTGKTHKTGCPLRVIVSERGSWLNEVSTYLQRSLSKLALHDPFLVRSSTELVQALVEGDLASATTGFSIDVRDLFYSVPQQGLFQAVRHNHRRVG
ncbi:hypothetical protein HPB48_017660 [Haemaphysalis longicornis]|uniref:Tick transposon n=1 Tax=Haemaphysalis longicornis TaxID=44386 RepID=A0A9J6GIU8_HAELO|nr:hypothetical protein HPB48_017660 [Haemaphysalis longicornis]